MANPLELVKAHPVAATVGAVVIFGAILFALNSGGGDVAVPVSGDPSGELAGQYAMQQLSISAGLEQSKIDAAKELATMQNTTAVTLAQLDSARAADEAQKGFQLELERLASSERVSTQQTTVQASLAQQTLQTQKDLATMQSSNIAAQLKAQRDLQLAGINAQLEAQRIASQPKGLLSWLFG